MRAKLQLFILSFFVIFIAMWIVSIARTYSYELLVVCSLRKYLNGTIVEVCHFKNGAKNFTVLDENEN
jgi:hypothetical protein